MKPQAWPFAIRPQAYRVNLASFNGNINCFAVNQAVKLFPVPALKCDGGRPAKLEAFISSHFLCLPEIPLHRSLDRLLKKALSSSSDLEEFSPSLSDSEYQSLFSVISDNLITVQSYSPHEGRKIIFSLRFPSNKVFKWHFVNNFINHARGLVSCGPQAGFMDFCHSLPWCHWSSETLLAFFIFLRKEKIVCSMWEG